MNLQPAELCLIVSALLACLMVGTLHLRVNLWLFGSGTLLIAVATAETALQRHELNLVVSALLILSIKAIGVPVFFAWTSKKLDIHRDVGATIMPPLAMHLSLLLFAASFILTRDLVHVAAVPRSWPEAAASISLIFTGMIVMLTRRLAISQIVGFLVIENGISVFALTQTHDMPMMVELGVLLDLLVAVMTAGLLIFRIQKGFEHIEVSKLSKVKD
jgi:hydrogenase-4 component E